MDKFTIITLLTSVLTFFFYSVAVRLIQGIFMLLTSVYPSSLLLGVFIGVYLFIPTRNKLRDRVMKYV